jgi:secreted trypsin-like serine protease
MENFKAVIKSDEVSIKLIRPHCCEEMRNTLTKQICLPVASYVIIVTNYWSCTFSQGDVGGPLNCNYPAAVDPRRVVFGVSSWYIVIGGACVPSYPSVFTRTAAYLDWIATNTP